MKIMNEIRWGIIGCGDVTEVKSGPGFQKAPHSRLVAVMRRNGELAKDYALRHGIDKWYSSADELIHDQEVDAVYIATPPAFHKEYALATAKAGKVVYVEKPMACTYSDCLAMIEACQLAGVPLFTAYYRRAQPKFQKIKELIDSKEIGAVRFVQVTHCVQPKPNDFAKQQQPWRVDKSIAGGGYFFDMGCHTLDFLDFLFGPITHVQGFASNQAGLYETEDIMTGSFVFTSGVHGVGTWCFSAFQNYEKNIIIGTKGSISFSTFGPEPIEMTTMGGIEYFSEPQPSHVAQPLIEAITRELIGLGISPSTGVSGARTSWVMEQLTRNVLQFL
jgi:predicted dehydrogenase